MAPSRSQAALLLDKAEKKAGSSTGWLSLFSASDKFEEAGDLFQQAANAFKLEENYTSAGDAFAKEAECREKSGEDSDAANAWWNAGKAYKQAASKESPQQMAQQDLSISAFQEAITFLSKGGRFRMAADRQKDIAQIYVQRGNMHDAAMAYEQAGKWFQQEDANAMASGCFKDAADLFAQVDEFGRAIARYEEVADHSLQSSLTKYNVKEYWLRSGLCALANSDSVTAKRNKVRYESLDPSFAVDRVGEFLAALIDAVETGDQQRFTLACKNYHQIKPLDRWKWDILEKIRKTIDDEPGLT